MYVICINFSDEVSLCNTFQRTNRSIVVNDGLNGAKDYAVLRKRLECWFSIKVALSNGSCFLAFCFLFVYGDGKENCTILQGI